MEHTEDMITMLHQIASPAFLVSGGIITAANAPALQLQLESGGPVMPLLHTGQEEYANFQNGCLYLTLTIGNTIQSASVTALDSTHLFVLEQDADQSELRSMALAAQALRTPLTSIMNIADRMFPLAAEDDTIQAANQVARINRGLYQMLRIVCNMSDAYRYCSDGGLRGEIRDISSLIREQFDSAAPLIQKTNLKLRFTGLQETIFGLVDAEKLERAISNILSNAIKYTPNGGCIEARLTRRGKMLYLTVQDSGNGIPPSMMGNIYHRYQRIPGIEDGRFGLGLGMVMIRSAASAHGGTVLMEQGEDFGLRLTMSIAIRQTGESLVRSPMLRVDYAGELNHLLLELSDCLPPDCML